jgi:hypothetical protein
MGLGHTGLEQGITRAHNDNRPGVTVQETRYNFVVSYVGTQHLDELGHSVHERDYPSTQRYSPRSHGTRAPPSTQARRSRSLGARVVGLLSTQRWHMPGHTVLRRNECLTPHTTILAQVTRHEGSPKYSSWAKQVTRCEGQGMFRHTTILPRVPSRAEQVTRCLNCAELLAHTTILAQVTRYEGSPKYSS